MAVRGYRKLVELGQVRLSTVPGKVRLDSISSGWLVQRKKLSEMKKPNIQ